MPSVVAFGDSYSEGYGARAEEAYPARLAAMIGVPVTNAGVSGETAEEGILRLERDVLARHPDIVIVEFGVNEAFRGYPVARALRGIEAIVARIPCKTVLVGVHFWSYQNDFDEGLQAIAAKHGSGLVLDALHGIVSSRRDRDDGDPALRSDAYHPNAKGYQILAERIAPVVIQAIARGS